MTSDRNLTKLGWAKGEFISSEYLDCPTKFDAGPREQLGAGIWAPCLACRLMGEQRFLFPLPALKIPGKDSDRPSWGHASTWPMVVIPAPTPAMWMRQAAGLGWVRIPPPFLCTLPAEPDFMLVTCEVVSSHVDSKLIFVLLRQILHSRLKSWKLWLSLGKCYTNQGPLLSCVVG